MNLTVKVLSESMLKKSKTFQRVLPLKEEETNTHNEKRL
jgi:hypothetical protein